MKELPQLIAAALDVRRRAYAPYSHYQVGAAVLGASGRIITGCNVENASYGLTCCAERVALFRAVAEGEQTFRALVLATENGGAPCGACRQVIWELSGDIPIVLVDSQGRIVQETSSAALLPLPFDSHKLPQDEST